MQNSRFQFLPLIENLEWPYIWGVFGCLLFVCTLLSVGPSVNRSVGRLVSRSGDLMIGDLADMVDLPDTLSGRPS